MFKLYLLTEAGVFFGLGFTATVIQLETMRNVSDQVFTTGVLLASLITWLARSHFAKSKNIEFLERNIGKFLIFDAAMTVSLVGVTFLDWNLRFLWMNSVQVGLLVIMSSIWEIVKRDKGEGPLLHNHLESAQSKGYFAGALLYLGVLQMDLSIGVLEALVIQCSLCLPVSVALWFWIKKAEPIKAS